MKIVLVLRGSNLAFILKYEYGGWSSLVNKLNKLNKW